MEGNELLEILVKEGYTNIRQIGGKLYAIHRFIFTTGLCVGLDEYCYQHRYCYELHGDAITALNEWDGTGDPSGPWIKQKGLGVDRANPKQAIEQAHN